MTSAPRTDLTRLLEFAARSRVPDGFGYLNADGSLRRGPVEAWITARMTHVFGLAALLGHPGSAELAAHGVTSLTDGPLRDRAHGGWSASTDDGTKAAYVHAFVLLAGATATTAGVPGGRRLLDDALAVWQQRFWDDAHGLVVDEWDAGFTVLDPYRGINANMHGVEATLAAADALAPTDHALAGQLRGRALRTTERVVHGWARERDWRLPEHFDPGWTPLPEYSRDRPADPFRPYGVTVGHQLEWARLCLHLSVALGEHAPDWLLPDAEGLVTAAVTRGWAADGHDGFVYTLDWQDRPVVPARMHWVLCEAVAYAAVRRSLGDDAGLPPDAELARWQTRWQDHGDAVFLDPAVGSWHHELTPEGRVGTSTWEGKPDAYHLAQMLLLLDRPVRGSIAAALAAGRG